MFLCVISVLGSQSRGAFIGMLVLGVMLFLKSQRKILVSVGLIFVLGFGITFMPQSWHDRMSTILNYEEDGSVQARFEVWDHAIDLMQQRPLIGGGFEAFRGNQLSASGGYRSAHSIYFQVLGEHGIIGFALYLLMGGSAYLLAGSVRRRCEAHAELEWAKNLSRMIQTSLVVFACGGVFLSFAYFELLFHLVAITVIVKSLVEEALSNQTKQAKVSSRRLGPLVGDMLGTQSLQSREQDSA